MEKKADAKASVKAVVEVTPSGRDGEYDLAIQATLAGQPMADAQIWIGVSGQAAAIRSANERGFLNHHASFTCAYVDVEVRVEGTQCDTEVKRLKGPPFQYVPSQEGLSGAARLRDIAEQQRRYDRGQ
ncbi:MAG: hypothetical protein WC516_03080 [Patescibacteria group bacterium]